MKIQIFFLFALGAVQVSLGMENGQGFEPERQLFTAAGTGDIATVKQVLAEAVGMKGENGTIDTGQLIDALKNQPRVNQSMVTGMLCLKNMKNEGNLCAKLLCRDLKPLLISHLGKYISFARLVNYRDTVLIFEKLTPLMAACLGRFRHRAPEENDAITANSEEICRILIAAGSDVNARSEGTTPLRLACHHHEGISGLLVEAGADVNADGVLDLAASNGLASLCELFIARGVNVNVQSNRGDIPLISACAQGLVGMTSALAPAYERIVRMLLAAGAEVNVVSDCRWSPLMHAAHNGSLAMCELLLQYGADMRLSENETSIHMAKPGQSDDYRAIVALLSDPEKIHAVIMRADNPNKGKMIMNSQAGQK